MSKTAFSFAALLGLGLGSVKAETPEKLQTWRDKAATDERYKQQDGEDDQAYTQRCETLDAEHAEPDGDETQAASQATSVLVTAEPIAPSPQHALREAAKIIAHGCKLGMVEVAGVLAFDERLSAQAGINILNSLAQTQPAAPAAQTPRGNLAARMAAAATPPVPSEVQGTPDPDSPQAFVQAVLAAGKKARGEA